MVFHIVSFLLIFTGIACLPICEEMYFHFLLAFFLFSFAYIGQTIKKFYLSKTARQILLISAIFLAGLALISVRKIGEWQLVWISWYLILAVQIIYLFKPKTSQGWLFSYLLSTLQLGIAAEFTKNPAFFIFYLLFLILSPVGFSMCILSSEIKENLWKFLKPRFPYIKWLSLTTLNIFFFTAIIFVILPRSKTPLLATKGKGELISKLKKTAVSDLEIMKGEKFRFPSDISLGEISKLKNKDTILMLVETDKPFLWRVKAFNHFDYDRGVWSVDTTGWKQFKVHNGLLHFKPLYLSQNELIKMRPEQFIHHKFYIKNFVQNLLPVAYQVLEIEKLPVSEIKMDDLENIFLPHNLDFNTVYTVVSIQKLLPPSLLRSLPRKYPEEIKKLYLQLPSDIDPKIIKLTTKILKNIPHNQYEEVAVLRKFLSDNYIYTTQPLSGKNQLSKFLFKEFKGDCEYFATALTIMLRIANIPARFVIGFSGGNYDSVSRTSIVTPEYTHAWVEIYFPEVGWLTCDPVPGGVNAEQWSQALNIKINKNEIMTIGKETTTPPEEEAIPPEEVTPPEEETIPPEEEEVTPPEKETIPPEEVTPPEEEAIPPEEEVTPPEKETITPEEEAIPPEEVTPPEEETIPPEEEVTPLEKETIPPEEEKAKILTPLIQFFQKLKDLWEKWVLRFSYYTQQLIINKIKNLILKIITFIKIIIYKIKYNLITHYKIYISFILLVLTGLVSWTIIKKLRQKKLEKEKIMRLLPKRKLTKEEKKITNFYLYILQLLEKAGYRRPKYLTPREYAYLFFKKGIIISKDLFYLTETFYKVSFGKLELASAEINKVDRAVKTIKEWLQKSRKETI